MAITSGTYQFFLANSPDRYLGVEASGRAITTSSTDNSTFWAIGTLANNPLAPDAPPDSFSMACWGHQPGLARFGSSEAIYVKDGLETMRMEHYITFDYPGDAVAINNHDHSFVMTVMDDGYVRPLKWFFPMLAYQTWKYTKTTWPPP